MEWARILASITRTVEKELLLRNEYLAAENRIVKAQLKGLSLWTIGLPMVCNGLLVVFIVNFVAAWGEYFLCLTLVDDEAKRTMPVVLAAAQGYWAWPNLAAVYVIVVTLGISCVYVRPKAVLQRACGRRVERVTLVARASDARRIGEPDRAHARSARRQLRHRRGDPDGRGRQRLVGGPRPQALIRSRYKGSPASDVNPWLDELASYWKSSSPCASIAHPVGDDS